MTFTDPGILGAKRSSYREANPRPLLKDIMRKGGDEKEWRERFWAEIEDDKDYLHAIVEYWMDNTIRSILMEKSPEGANAHAQKITTGRRTSATTTRGVKAALRERVQQEVKIVLLQMMMPNGKLLADCTGSDCRHFGGWYAALAKRVPANATVADTLSEREVTALWRKSK